MSPPSRITAYVTLDRGEGLTEVLVAGTYIPAEPTRGNTPPEKAHFEDIKVSDNTGCLVPPDEYELDLLETALFEELELRFGKSQEPEEERC